MYMLDPVLLEKAGRRLAVLLSHFLSRNSGRCDMFTASLLSSWLGGAERNHKRQVWTNP